MILVPTDRTLYGGLRLIALVYLGIGMYVLLRRWTAPRSTHFYIFCLVSFIFYSFHYTGKLNDFDWIVYWSNVVAWLLQPAIFLHFSLVFPERKRLVLRRPWLIPLVYVPGFAAAGTANLRGGAVPAQRTTSLDARPHFDGLSGGLFRAGGIGVVAQLPLSGDVHPAPADEVGNPRDHSRGGAVHDFLRNTLSVLEHARRWR